MPIENYHTHTFRCHHASGDFEDYCEVAVQNKMKILGFSDHTPLKTDVWKDIRMELSQLKDYCSCFSRAKTLFPQLTLYLGLECEYDRDYETYYRNEILGRPEIDYLVAGIHFFKHNGNYFSPYSFDNDKTQLQAYAKSVVSALESGLFVFLAHPDVFSVSYTEWDQVAIDCSSEICKAAKANDVPLEINGSGYRKSQVVSSEGRRHAYPNERFWEIAAKLDVEVVANSDAHSPMEVCANIDDCLELAKRLGLRTADMTKRLKRD